MAWHGHRSVPVPGRLGGLDQHLDLARRQVLSGAELGGGARKGAARMAIRPSFRIAHNQRRLVLTARQTTMDAAQRPVSASARTNSHSSKLRRRAAVHGYGERYCP